ncbi:MAG: 3-deoxy-7-phosphoheptulonate synthase [Kiritimatiellia bacterium]
MIQITDDIRIAALKPLIPPAILMEELPITDAAAEEIGQTRVQIENCLSGKDHRLVVIVGPCSIHDADAAREYAALLKKEADRLADDLLIIMRVYFEKPRTSVGWKGLINDPMLDGTFAINKGLRIARKLLLDISDAGLPCGCEFLDTIMPQFIADLVSWGAIGARTTESQVHRELASGLSCPIGFKNATNGNIQVAVDAIEAARHPHHFLSVTKQGVAAIVATKGNPACHLILRGGSAGPNDDPQSIQLAAAQLAAQNLPSRVMIDCSHGNSRKQYQQQPVVAGRIADQIRAGCKNTFGLMIESHLHPGRQDIVPGIPLEYGKSITDACLGWGETKPALELLAQAIRASR